MTKEELKENLLKLEGKIQDTHEANTIRIEFILDLLKSDSISDDTISSLKSVASFKKMLSAPTSVLDNYSDILQLMLDELRKNVNLKEEQERNCIQKIRTSAIRQKRAESKGKIFLVVIILGILASAAIVLGILAAVNVIGEWGRICVDLIGVFDCAAGLIFFAYEFYNDKVNEGKINDGDFETVQKYLSKDDIADVFRVTMQKTGDISNTGAVSVNVTGMVNAPIINGSTDSAVKEVERLFNKYYKN